MSIRLTTYQKGSVVPPLPGSTLTHSTELFHIYEQTPGYAPILIVATKEERPVAKLLAVIRRSARLFPPSIIKRCEVFGDGEYFDESLKKEDLFGLILEHLTKTALKDCFLIEFRNLSTSLYGYGHFRRNGYFPINWLRVYNSLHSLPPEERLEPSRKRQINRAIKNGVTTQVAGNEEEINAFLRILKRNYSSKLRKHFPDLQLFRLLMQKYPEKETARIFLVKYGQKVIGGAFCLFSGENAYLGFSGGMNKTYPLLSPNTMAVWAAITYAFERKYQHFEFADAGLPFQKMGYRNFILSFGGKQVSTRRWFRFRWNWLNSLLIKLYR
mgnify:FL=1